MGLRRELRHKLELDQYFDVEREWVAEGLEAIASKARENSVYIKKILNFTIPKINGCRPYRYLRYWVGKIHKSVYLGRVE